MNEPKALHKGQRARIGSIAAGYLGVSWLILQVIDVVLDILPLPSWVAKKRINWFLQAWPF